LLAPTWHALSRFRRVVTLALGLSCVGCVYGRIAYYNAPSVSNPGPFERRVISASARPAPLPKPLREAPFRLIGSERGRYRSFGELLEAQRTRAFLVIHDDRIVYERYFHGVSATSELSGFSMSKTVAAVVIGRALSQGLLPSLDEPVTTYIPELRGKHGYGEVTLERLLRMTSGIDFDEESMASAKLYYTTHLRQMLYSYDVKWPPGERYLYGSINIQLLWDVLQRRLGRESVSHYVEQQVWGPLGAEAPASYFLDSAASGVEKFFGGFNATARDYARFGLLFLHGGMLNGRQVLPHAWIEQALMQDPIAGLVHTSDGWVWRGMYQWFITRDRRAYFAKGYNGQYVFVVPERRAVFVRFGEGYGNLDWPALFLRLADAL
jgi:CubicO group peptidase (beta-lactamase class C family)